MQETRRRTRHALAAFGLTASLGLSVAGINPATAAAPTAAPSAAISTGATAGFSTGVKPLICNPTPTEYPGCTAEQLRPLLRLNYVKQFRGIATHYSNIGHGQTHVIRPWLRITPTQRAKMVRLYNAARERFEKQAPHFITNDSGERVKVSSTLPYHYFAGFAAHSHYACPRANLQYGTPAQYCAWNAITGAINHAISVVTHLVFGCNGDSFKGFIGGGVVGSVSKAIIGTGIGFWKAGAFGALGGFASCEAGTVWDWANWVWDHFSPKQGLNPASADRFGTN